MTHSSNTELAEKLRKISKGSKRPVPPAVLLEAADAIEYLEKRLEVVPGWSEDADGISCRNDTIRLQDARIDALEEDADRLFFMLGELLAVIHRDGGQYTGEHGLDKSWVDAMQLSSERIASVDELTAARDQYAGLYADRCGQFGIAQSEAARLRGLAEALMAALEPFARLAKTWTVETASDLLTLSNGTRMCGVNADDFRRARAALQSASQGEG